MISFSFIVWTLFMLGTCTLYKGGVMIRWLGHLGCYVGTSDCATDYFVCCGGVLGHLYNE